MAEAAPIVITPKGKKPLHVDYGGTVYVLPGRVPPEVLTAQSQVRKPTLTTAAQNDEYKRQVGGLVVTAFYELVVPADFKQVLDLEDLGPVFEAWSEHVELGKAPNSKG